ncbi:preprotein translocase subunit SecG domain protein [Ancylostoma caninum]|uniref:Preprotein translocase subunit SecG domain protein n=1 Tax=Ancylostoma caninum TaxID=29170 RepID=A0A368GYP3_ANCCA|nr:preprotein translocase subunit SecG domain protein [Ancylostoma caninum]
MMHPDRTRYESRPSEITVAATSMKYHAASRPQDQHDPVPTPVDQNKQLQPAWHVTPPSASSDPTRTLSDFIATISVQSQDRMTCETASPLPLPPNRIVERLFIENSDNNGNVYLHTLII